MHCFEARMYWIGIFTIRPELEVYYTLTIELNRLHHLNEHSAVPAVRQFSHTAVTSFPFALVTSCEVKLPSFIFWFLDCQELQPDSEKWLDIQPEPDTNGDPVHPYYEGHFPGKPVLARCPLWFFFSSHLDKCILWRKAKSFHVTFNNVPTYLCWTSPLFHLSAQLGMLNSFF